MLAITLFLLGAAFFLYVLVGYPLLLRVWSGLQAPAPRRTGTEETVSIVIAVHNGGQFLADKLRSVFALDYPEDRREVIVVSDGSTDQTEEIAASFPGVQLVRVPRGGKCAALNAGIARASGNILVLTDVRQVLDRESVRLLVDRFADPRVGVVSGELIIRDGETLAEADVGMYWRFESWVRRSLSRIDSMFGATGPFYAMRRELAVPVPADVLLDDMYLPLAAYFRGYRLIVEPAARAYDFPTSLETEFRRKVRTLAGNYQLLKHYPQLLGPRNRMWLHYMSYKMGRLLLPFSLVLIAATSPFLPYPWNWLACLGQLGFYGLAAVDGLLPAGFPLKRLTSLVRTFVTMMTAAVYALSVFFVPPQSLWKVTNQVGRARSSAPQS